MPTLRIPDDLKEALEELGAVGALNEMPLNRRKRAFLFIEQATNAPSRGLRVTNFVEVVKFFKQDSEGIHDPDRSP